MKARIEAGSKWKETKHYNDKELTESWSVVVIHKGKMKNPVNVRIFMGRSSSASRVYANIWCYPASGEARTGGGHADGGGYHKPSAAMQSAMDDAGIKLYRKEPKHGEITEYIDGHGDSAMRDALEAITRAAGYRGQIKIIN